MGTLWVHAFCNKRRAEPLLSKDSLAVNGTAEGGPGKYVKAYTGSYVSEYQPIFAVQHSS